MALLPLNRVCLLYVSASSSSCVVIKAGKKKRSKNICCSELVLDPPLAFICRSRIYNLMGVSPCLDALKHTSVHYKQQLSISGGFSLYCLLHCLLHFGCRTKYHWYTVDSACQLNTNLSTVCQRECWTTLQPRLEKLWPWKLRF